MHAMEDYSAMKKGSHTISNNMNELGGQYAKWSKPDKEKYCIISLICVI